MWVNEFSLYNNALLFTSILAIEVAEDLRKYILEIYDDHLSSDGFVSAI